MSAKNTRRRPSTRAPDRNPERRAPRGRNEVRIIAGSWRGRRVRFPEVAALRPTPDRVRETLFNWLQPVVAASRCLDLFAGSGALGLEALSRGAAHVTFVDSDTRVAECLRVSLRDLGSSGGDVRCQDAHAFLASAPVPFDIVFLDPPFRSGALAEICRHLEERGWLAPRALIYLEAPARSGAPELPASWSLARSKRAGEVGYHLAQRGGA